MQSRFKVFSGLFLLILFLYPQVQKGLHDFEHRNDFHCNTASETHLHQKEHICSICDFSIAVNFTGISDNPYIFPEVINIHFQDAVVPFVPVIFWKSLPPRAPPVV